MKIAIVDDDRYWREYAARIVQKYYAPTPIDINIFKNGKEYLESRECYDISFVDIEMPEIDGFQTITKAKKINREGIFTILTTHMELSTKGYRVDAFRYIDKTKIEEEMYEALKSAEIVLGRNEKIRINVIQEGQREIILKNIFYIETEKHYLLIHTNHGIYKCDINLCEMEDMLRGKWFFRCHKSYIANLDEITEINEIKACMSNGDEIFISKRKFYELKRAYMDRQFECANE